MTVPFRRLAPLAVVLCLAAGCSRTGGRAPNAAASDPPLPPGLVAGETLYGFDSTFTDQGGRVAPLARFGGRPVLLAMVYTHCTSACPRLLASVQRIERGLSDADRARTAFVLVTLDPAHDSPDTLRAFAASRGLAPGRWTLLQGSRATTIELAAILGVKVRDDGAGALAHSSNIYLLDGAGVIRRALVGLDADPADMIAARAALD